MKVDVRAWLLAPALSLLAADADADPSPANTPAGPLSGLYAVLSHSPLAAPPKVTPSPPLRQEPVALRRRFHRRSILRSSVTTLRSANAKALSQPHLAAFVNAALVYDYEIGRLYRIDASPRFLTTIALRPGEHLVSKAAGDTVRWVLGETVQGSGETAQSLVMIKPVRGDLRTNLVLTTDQRSYFLEAVSHEEPVYTSIVSWNYPRDLAADLRPIPPSRSPANERTSEAAAPSIAPERLNFGYRIEHPHQKRAPAWEPERVFDDGAKTFIQFSSNFSTGDAPPLFLIGPKDQAELVNYHVFNRYYVVDRLLDKAELRLGENPQVVVRITRSGAPG